MLGETVNITVYRIVQECLTNVVRHAAARHADIVRRAAGAAGGRRLEVTVGDNGRGLGERNERDAARFGLMGMRERVEALGGNFTVESRPGEGLTVRGVDPARRHCS